MTICRGSFYQENPSALKKKRMVKGEREKIKTWLRERERERNTHG